MSIDIQPEYNADLIKSQYDYGPYPRVPFDKTPQDLNLLFVNDVRTAFYLRDQKVVNGQDIKILDVGCGSGYTTLSLAIANPDSQIVGIDFSAESIAVARDRIKYHGLQDRVTFEVLALEELDQLGQKFDYISCLEILYFFDDPVTAMNQVRAVLAPDGIIRANFHDKYGRAPFHQLQHTFKIMGMFDGTPDSNSAGLVRNFMHCLSDNVVTKLRSNYAHNKNRLDDEFILRNHLLAGDHGYNFPEILSILNQADLNFIRLIDWFKWDISLLFDKIANLDPVWHKKIENLSDEEKLTLFDLLNPVHRLLDFWCSPIAYMPPKISPHSSWTAANWQTATVYIHPQLNTEKFWQAVELSIQKSFPLDMAMFLNLTNSKKILLSSPTLATCIHPLKSGKLTFQALLDHWLKLYPINPLTLAKHNEADAFQHVKDLINQLAEFVFVLVEC